MIVVIADDFSGAAEIAGIGNAFGLSTLLLTSMEHYSPCDLLVLDSGTRSLTEDEAATVIRNMAREIRERITTEVIVFKKIDSILRGHVLLETSILKTEFNYNLVLLGPANPSKGRKIIQGEYQIHGQLLDQTSFSLDPEYPRTTADIGELLGKRRLQEEYFHLQERELISGKKGYRSIDVHDSNDLRHYAQQVSDEVLLAGGAELFEMLLLSRGLKKISDSMLRPIKGTSIFVIGSLFSDKRENDFIDQILASRNLNSGNSTSITYFPSKTTTTGFSKIVSSYDGSVLSISSLNTESDHKSLSYSHILAATVRDLFDTIGDRHINLIISGGTTASSILRHLKIESFQVITELGPGVVALKPFGHTSFIIIIKPGSYSWPGSLKTFLSLN